MSDQTALESHELVVTGDRAELRLEQGRIVIHKQATTQARPTEVAFGVDQVRGATLQTPRGIGWLHVSVVGGSPPPPSELAAMGDPYTLALTGRGTSAARRLVKMVERHVQERGMPSEVARVSASSGVIVRANDDRPVAPPPGVGVVSNDGVGRAAGGAGGTRAGEEEADADDMVTRLRELADLHDAGALTDAEFELAKARVLG